jgi:hypothetical protein
MQFQCSKCILNKILVLAQKATSSPISLRKSQFRILKKPQKFQLCSYFDKASNTLPCHLHQPKDHLKNFRPSSSMAVTCTPPVNGTNIKVLHSIVSKFSTKMGTKTQPVHSPCCHRL